MWSLQDANCWRIRRQLIKHLSSSIKATQALYLDHITETDHQGQFNSKHCYQPSQVKALFSSHYHVALGLLPDNSQKQPCVIATLNPVSEELQPCNPAILLIPGIHPPGSVAYLLLGARLIIKTRCWNNPFLCSESPAFLNLSMRLLISPSSLCHVFSCPFCTTQGL